MSSGRTLPMPSGRTVFVVSYLLLLPVMTGPSLLSGQTTVMAGDRWNRAALEWVGFLQAGEFQEAGAVVDPAVPEGVLGPEELQAIWAQISDQLGSVTAVNAGVVSEVGQYHAVDLPADFENQSLVIRVVLTDSLLVSGLFFRASEPPAYQTPEYVDEASFQEEDVTVGADPWALPGTLSLPRGEGPFPAVVLVHGSGPNDRDETVGGNRPFRDLAWGLASRGIAVLRYDKRTQAHGPRIPGDIGLEEEVVLDALSALSLARSRPEIHEGRVVLLGHSLGGMLAPRIGSRDGRTAGVVVLAAPSRPFFHVIKSQLQYLASLETDPASPAKGQLDSLIRVVESVEAGTASPQEVVLGAPPAYWREVAEVDPVAEARDLAPPLFVLQGGRDYQSTAQDLELWRESLEGKDGFSAKLYPALNHLFGGGEGTAIPEEYMAEVKHVDVEVVEDLAAWILARSPVGG